MEKLNLAVAKKEIEIRKWKIGMCKWWDKDCMIMKREVKKALKDWKRGKIEVDSYREKRKEYKKRCEEKRKEYQKQQEEEIDQIKNVNEVWKYINEERKRRIKITERFDVKNGEITS